MKSVGLIGGTGPESTIEYYRTIIASYREKKGDGSYPSIVVNSIDMKKMLDLIEAKRLADVTEYLLGEVRKLGRAGADFGVLAANTPHIVFDALCEHLRVRQLPSHISGKRLFDFFSANAVEMN